MSTSQIDVARAAEYKGTLVTVITSVFIVLATLAVIGRFCARRIKSVALGADDWLIFLSLVCIF
jgi:hypothetical protein